MKLLLTSHRFWPNVGGTETAVEQLARHFARRGHEVTVATMAEPGCPEEETREGYRIRRFEMRRVGKFRLPPASYRRFVLDEDWDLVHLVGQRVWSSDWLYAHLRRARCAIVFTAYGFAQWRRADRKPFVDAAYYKLVLPRALRHVTVVTAATAQERDDLLSFGVPADKIVLMGTGYEPAEFDSLPAGFRQKHGFGPDEPILLYAGGFYANKRVDRLVEAAGGTGATLVVLGKDADGLQAGCERLAAERGTKLRVLGRIPREDYLSAFREADLFVFGSDFEGFGIVVLEAMAAGLPFVSTPAGAAPDLAATGAGVIAADADAMRHEIRALLADPARRAAMGRIGKEAAKARTWSAVADDYLRLFEDVGRR